MLCLQQDVTRADRALRVVRAYTEAYAHNHERHSTYSHVNSPVTHHHERVSRLDGSHCASHGHFHLNIAATSLTMTIRGLKVVVADKTAVWVPFDMSVTPLPRQGDEFSRVEYLLQVRCPYVGGGACFLIRDYQSCSRYATLIPACVWTMSIVPSRAYDIVVTIDYCSVLCCACSSRAALQASKMSASGASQTHTSP